MSDEKKSAGKKTDRIMNCNKWIGNKFYGKDREYSFDLETYEKYKLEKYSRPVKKTK